MQMNHLIFSSHFNMWFSRRKPYCHICFLSINCNTVLIMYMMKIQSPKALLLEKKGENNLCRLFQLIFFDIIPNLKNHNSDYFKSASVHTGKNNR